MAILDAARTRVDPPAILPVDYLSLSSIKQFQMCPWKWKLRYIDHLPEPPSGKMVLGSAAGAALAQHFGRQVDEGEGISTEQLLDEFSSEWEDRCGREDVDYGSEIPGALKDSGAGALSIYHRIIAPSIEPVAVEREFELQWPGVEWKVTGFIDLEDSAGRVRDYKMTNKRISQAVADNDLQGTTYLADRRAEGNPAPEFCFDTLLRQAQPKAEVVTTTRTDAQLDFLTDRLFSIAAEIAWRCETDTWIGAAPGTWFCSTCRYTNCNWRLG